MALGSSVSTEQFVFYATIYIYPRISVNR